MAVQSKNRKATLKEKQASMDEYINMIAGTGNKYHLFIKEHAQYWTPQKLPRKYRAGVVKECFKNAFDLVMADQELTYVEGLAFGIIPTEHAWVIDKSGNVIDNTWNDPSYCVYLGIPFDFDYIAKTIVERGYYGIIMDWQRGFPLMKGEHGGPDKWKHGDYR